MHLTLAREDANPKLVEVVTVADNDDEDPPNKNPETVIHLAQ